MYELDEEEEEEELEPVVRYSVLQKEEYSEDDEEDPVPYVDIGPGYYFLDNN
jgi:hypothetical protein